MRLWFGYPKINKDDSACTDQARDSEIRRAAFCPCAIAPRDSFNNLALAFSTLWDAIMKAMNVLPIRDTSVNGSLDLAFIDCVAVADVHGSLFFVRSIRIRDDIDYQHL